MQLIDMGTVGEKEKNIVYICDENYLLPTIVSIQSLIENIDLSEGLNYKVHICTVSVDREHQKELSRLGNSKVEICIHDIDPCKYLKIYGDIQQKTHVTLTALLKFELPDILPDIHEVLYLDSDVIANQSISCIFNYNISAFALAASFDIVLYRALSNYAHPLVKPMEFYFNSGVMLLNLDKFRKENYPRLLREEKLQLSDTENPLNLMDQNVLNQILSKDCLPLPIRFNCPNQYPASLSIDINDINLVYETNYKSTVDLLDDAVLIHYIGRRSKPWKYEKCTCREIWDFYCNKAGIDTKTLNRIADDKSKKTDLGKYGRTIRRLLSTVGVEETIRYVLYRIRMKIGRR